MTESNQQEIAEIWALFRESREQILLLQEQSKETDRRFKETERLLREESLKTERLLREESLKTDQQFQETERLLREASLKTDQRMNQLMGKFDSQWGLLIENLVKPSALRLFQEWGLHLNYVYPRVEGHKNGKSMELDLLLTNTTELVVVEAKSRLNQQDVEDLLEDLGQFPRFFPIYGGYRVYGAVAGLDIPENISRWAYRKGLFVLSLTGEGIVEIKNDAQFRPTNFADQAK